MASSPSDDDLPQEEISTPKARAKGDAPEEPGGPIARDYVDPELLSLSGNRARVGPVMAASIIVFCAFFMIRLRSDLAFSLKDETPKRARSAAEVVNGGAGVNDFVRVTVQPDRSFALHIAPSAASEGHRLTPVHGTRDRLWLLEPGSSWSRKGTYDTSYQGRLRYLSDLPFHGRLRSHLSKAEPAPRYVPTDRVRQALKERRDAVATAAGDPIPVTASTAVILHERSANQVNIRAYLGERHPDSSAWKKSLVAAGVLTAQAKPTAVTGEVVTWQASDPEGVEGVAKKLAAAKLFGARARALEHRYQAEWGKLEAGASGISIGSMTLPWNSISSVSLLVPRRIPSDAMVLIDGERPGAYWYMKLVYGLLVLFMILFTWAFVRSVRRSAPPSTDEPLSAAGPLASQTNR